MNIKAGVPFIAVVMIVMYGAIAMAQQKTNKSTTGLENVVLDEQAVKKLSNEALDGSGLAARKLSMHYALSKPKDREMLYWAVIGAENGDVVSQYNAGQYMLEDSDPSARRRGKYWLKKAAAAGHQHAVDVLKEIND